MCQVLSVIEACNSLLVSTVNTPRQLGVMELGLDSPEAENDATDNEKKNLQYHLIY